MKRARIMADRTVSRKQVRKANDGRGTLEESRTTVVLYVVSARNPNMWSFERGKKTQRRLKAPFYTKAPIGDPLHRRNGAIE